ncbi:hypothetical protein OG21DRAFT_1605063 [Imleria badia]|nr:hypothetical protein OG21DRAFT_1605063 [Imleria badia]
MTYAAYQFWFKIGLQTTRTRGDTITIKAILLERCRLSEVFRPQRCQKPDEIVDTPVGVFGWFRNGSSDVLMDCGRTVYVCHRVGAVSIEPWAGIMAAPSSTPGPTTPRDWDKLDPDSYEMAEEQTPLATRRGTSYSQAIDQVPTSGLIIPWTQDLLSPHALNGWNRVLHLYSTWSAEATRPDDQDLQPEVVFHQKLMLHGRLSAVDANALDPY